MRGDDIQHSDSNRGSDSDDSMLDVQAENMEQDTDSDDLTDDDGLAVKQGYTPETTDDWILRIYHDLLHWWKKTDDSNNPLTHLLLLQDNNDVALCGRVTEMDVADIRDTVRRTEANVSEALLHNRLAYIQLADWVEFWMDQLRAQGTPKSKTKTMAVNELLEGVPIAPGKEVPTRKKWLRDIRTGHCWKSLCQVFDLGILLLPNGVLGVSTYVYHGNPL